MNIHYPHTIQNTHGETLTFLAVEKGPLGDKVLVESQVTPGSGPPMHTHLRQEEELTVVSGKMAYQILGQEPQYAFPGERVLFKRGVAHKFWNAGDEMLICKGWVAPANSIVYYLSAIYAAQNKSGKQQPEAFDGAYLMTRYATEYEMPELPFLVKKAIIPLTYFIGRLLGKYKHFTDAPAPLP
ncbi:cupin domain-containing protein [Larkinella bovis]|uniref:Cupin domain-containing protein n=1 Tax=Larkinella bovis TaxID=683041 RepID=A0ABW0I7Z1_9BACT